MKKRALVTGGAGFVGSHLCERLHKNGYFVVCLDNLQTGSLANLSELLGKDDFVFEYQSVENDISYLTHYNFDEIYNLACPASPIHYQKDPIQTTMTSVVGAYNVLRLAKKCNAKCLQASTSEVYGNPLVHPQVESYFGNVNPDGIRSCYDEGKRCAESLFFDFNRSLGVKIKVVRIFNTYGERMAQDDGRVVSNFIIQALKGEDITIYGDGTQTRSFQYVSDLIDGIIAMMNSSDEFLGPVNIGNPEEYTMLELAENIISLTNSKSKISYKPLPSDDPTKRKPNIELAKATLNWCPKVHVKEGLKRTIKYFDEALRNQIS